MVSRNERARALLRNDSVDLNMRPALGTLINKIENMSFVKDQPEVYEWIIGQLAWRYTRRFNRIQGLERLIRSMHLLASQTALPEWGENLEEALVHAGIAVTGVGDSPQVEGEEVASGVEWTPDFKIVHGGQHRDEVCPDCREWRSQNAENIVSEGSENSKSREGDSESPKLLDILKDEFKKQGAQAIIEDHLYNAHMMSCECGRTMADHHAWAKHLRIRLWRYLAGKVDEE